MGTTKDLQVCYYLVITTVIVFTLCNPISVRGQGDQGPRRPGGNGNANGNNNEYEYNGYEDYEYGVEEYEEGNQSNYFILFTLI